MVREDGVVVDSNRDGEGGQQLLFQAAVSTCFTFLNPNVTGLLFGSLSPQWSIIAKQQICKTEQEIHGSMCLACST